MNEALQNPFIVLRDHGLDPRLAALIDRLTYSPVGEDLAARALSLLDERPVPDEKALHASLTPFIWFLDRAAEGGIQLTASGYLKPADVTAAAEVLPTMHGWIGKANREIDTTPVLDFRKALQALGLVRKHKGSLLLHAPDTIRAPRGRPYGTNWRTASSRTPTGSTPMRRCCCSSTRQRPLTASFRSTRSRQRSPTWAGRAAMAHRSSTTTCTGCALLMFSATCRPRTSAEATVGGSAAKSQSSRAQRSESRNAHRGERAAGDGDDFGRSVALRRAMFPIGAVAGFIDRLAAQVPEREH